MKREWKTVRVFISSTFCDMQAERDHLVRFVFPKLRDELLVCLVHLVDVDLRWGVTGDQDTLSVCREIVDECRPRFLCILGGRYGWVPDGKDRSITADEVYYGVLDRDGESRGYAFFYFRDPLATAAMAEQRLGEFREPIGSDDERRLQELKDNIEEAGLTPFIYPAQWDSSTKRLIGLKEFGDQVYRDLLKSIKSDPELRERFGDDSDNSLEEFAEENAAMDAFIAEHTERFVLGSREIVSKELLDYVGTTRGPGYLCLVGEPGSGKSALLSHFVHAHDVRTPGPEYPESLVLISHFVGASTGSTDVRRTLRRLCHELVTCTNIRADIPDDPEELRAEFHNMLKQACVGKRVVILLDAVNQFDPSPLFDGLSWLPEELPEDTRVILSTVPGPALDELNRRRHPTRYVTLAPLTHSDGEAIVKEFLHRFRKTLTDVQRGALLSKTDSGAPLYLLAALEELRTLGAYDEITDRIDQLPLDTISLFVWILRRLERDDGFRDASGRKIGGELVSQFVSLLAASRHGLRQRELAELLAVGDLDANPAIPHDAQGNVAALIQLLRPYLMYRGELLDFYHGQFRAAAETTYLAEEQHYILAHSRLAKYFDVQDSWSEVSLASQRGWLPNARKADELPWQMLKANDRGGLERVLCDFDFVDAKCAAGMLFDLVGDYNRALDNREAQPQAVRHDLLSAIVKFLHANAHVLIHHPDSFIQEAYNFGDNRISQLAELIVNDPSRPSDIWLRLVNRDSLRNSSLPETLAFSHGCTSVAALRDGQHILAGDRHGSLKLWDLQTGQCVRHVQAHDTEINDIAVSLDGRLAVTGAGIWNADRKEVVAALTTIAGWPARAQQAERSTSGEAKVWDLVTMSCISTLGGHSEKVTGVAFTSDSQQVLTASSDNTVKLWCLRTGSCLRTLEGHEDEVFAVAVTPDDVHAVTASRDKTARIWELRTGECRATLLGHAGWVRDVAVTPDGRNIATISDDRTVKVWDLTAGTCLRTIDTGSLGCQAVTMTEDGEGVISGHVGSTIKIWNLSSGENICTLKGGTGVVESLAVTPDGKRIVSAQYSVVVRELVPDKAVREDETDCHTEAVHVLALTPDGRRVLTGSSDKTIRIWNTDNGQCMRTLVGHAEEVTSLVVTPDGRYAVSSAREDTARVWDLETGACLRTLGPHIGPIESVTVTPDGRFALTGAGSRVKSYGDVKIWDLSHGIGEVGIWELASGTRRQLLQGHREPVTAVIALPTGAIVSMGDSREVKEWDFRTGKCVSALERSPFGVKAIAMAPDAKHLIVPQGFRLPNGMFDSINAVKVTPNGRLWLQAHDSSFVTVYDCDTREWVRTLKGHSARVNGLDVTPDSQFVISSSIDNTLRVWDLSNGVEIAFFEDADAFNCVCATNSERTVFVAGSDGGKVHFLRLEGVVRGPQNVTAWCRPSGFLRKARIGFGCLLCRKWSEIAEGALGTDTSCPHCGRTVRLNTFVVEADWYPIAEVWNGG